MITSCYPNLYMPTNPPVDASQWFNHVHDAGDVVRLVSVNPVIHQTCHADGVFTWWH